MSLDRHDNASMRTEAMQKMMQIAQNLYVSSPQIFKGIINYS